MKSLLLIQKAALGIVLAGVAALPAAAQFSLSIAVNLTPPELPVYVQPECPAPNYIWTPGFWAWGDEGYYWVPGTWVPAPEPGLLWTPGYWGFGSGGYLWHTGYWGPQVGFYGGINYGFGYAGTGFVGGAWRGGFFSYNTAVLNVNRSVVTNVYVDRTVIHNVTINNTYVHTSFNGGPQGVPARPTQQEQAFARQPHVQATAVQTQHLQVAAQDRANFASVNHGVPAHAAVARPVSNPEQLNRAAMPARGAVAAPGGGRPGGFNNGGAPGNPGVRPYTPATVAARPGVNAPQQPGGRFQGAPVAQPAARPGAPPAQQPHPAAAPKAQPAPRPNAKPEKPQHEH